MQVLVWAVSLLPIAVVVGLAYDDCQALRPAELLANLTAAYDRKRRPNATGAPVDVYVQIKITSLAEINQKEEKLGISGIYRVWWKDTRLAYPNISQGGCFDRLPLENKERDMVWQPDLFFENVLSETYGHRDLFVVLPSGEVQGSKRMMNHIFACSMNFRKLPFDEQTCSIQIASFSLDAGSVRIQPKGGDAEGLTLSADRPDSTAWNITEVRSETMERIEKNGGRAWTVHLKVVLKRKWGYWITSVGVKAVLFVVISWCGFFINRTLAPARVSIGVMPVLIMINLINATEGHLPPLPYSTTLHNYLMTCLVFTSTGVLEYALVAYLLQREVWHGEKYAALLRIGKSNLKRRERREPDSAIAEGADDPAGESPVEETMRPRPAGLREESMRLRATDSTVRSRRSSRTRGRKTERPTSRIFDEHPVISSIFKEFDRERNGKYSVSEVRAALRGFGQYRSHREVREMFHLVGVVPGEDMTLQQFEQFLEDPEQYMPVTGTRKSFWDMPPSLQLDLFMRFAYPFVWFSTSMIHGAIVLL